MSNKFKHLKQSKFPVALKPLLEIPEPPESLWLSGELPNEDSVILAVVGSRKFSSYGETVVSKLILGLEGYPISIVSGLALGIDALAHIAALEADLHTIAMPGSGLDESVLHPRTNHGIAREIIDSGGALLSELEPLQPAGMHTFPRRNRLMAGLARATLVVEAGERSGTLITARLTTDYNREVLAVPGNITQAGSYGTNWLIKQGATPITDSADILEALGFGRPKDETQSELALENLSSPERRVIELLAREPLPRDEILRQLGLPISEASTVLASLEIKGLITERLGLVQLS